jgi:16S rRNA (uracil1498-N3)-methyltransferase
MQRFFVPPPIGPTVDLSAEQARQLATVIRARPGDHVVVLDGEGQEYEVELTTVRKDVATGRVIDQRPGRGEPRTRVVLYQSLLKGDKLDWVVQKAVEVGVSEIVPVLTTRCVADDLSPSRRARLQRIAQEAAEQSGRARVPAIGELQTLGQAIAGLRIPGAIPWEGERHHLLGSVLASIRQAGGREIAVFVGPEGGYEPAEVDRARSAGVQPVSLGERILRAETAAIVAVALAVAENGVLG